ncbi:hypothetical protein HDE69_000679 [Pedobacter cryoconitis]|uniref:Uncharacterized protein n=1 Tax=Pedobacter cryoconitis TaxID=188932 RepID=A0A7W9DI12_9SPHI|nr:hypothetical protein [Pedobacter cryoconitis]MBB5619641.1 hypothetical protein [Pedobacter cryoconitis]
MIRTSYGVDTGLKRFDPYQPPINYASDAYQSATEHSQNPACNQVIYELKQFRTREQTAQKSRLPVFANIEDGFN